MKLMKPKSEIIQDYAKIINHTINDMKLGYKRDELFDIGMVGFVKGINTFDETKAYQSISYLFECIKNEINHYIQYENRLKRKCEIISLNTKIYDNIELQDVIGYETDYLQENYTNELLNMINDRISFMTNKQQIIINHLYGLNGYKELTAKEIYKIYGYSKQDIYQNKRRICNMLRHTILQSNNKTKKRTIKKDTV